MYRGPPVPPPAAPAPMRPSPPRYQMEDLTPRITGIPLADLPRIDRPRREPKRPTRYLSSVTNLSRVGGLWPDTSYTGESRPIQDNSFVGGIRCDRAFELVQSSTFDFQGESTSETQGLRLPIFVDRSQESPRRPVTYWARAIKSRAESKGHCTILYECGQLQKKALAGLLGRQSCVEDSVANSCGEC